MERIVVVDYNMGNLRSVAKALEHVAGPQQQVRVSGDPAAVAAADRVVFPGQGAIRDCMAELTGKGLVEPVLEAMTARPFLGICMGLQGLMEHSEECPDTPGLGVLKGGVHRLPARDPTTGERLTIPHMGWNGVHHTADHPLWTDIPEGDRFYFVHSYYVDPADRTVITGTCHYGREFVCAIARDNLFAVQFHPEKSQRAGLQLLENFVRWRP